MDSQAAQRPVQALGLAIGEENVGFSVHDNGALPEPIEPVKRRRAALIDRGKTRIQLNRADEMRRQPAIQRRQRALSLLDELLLFPVRIHVPHQTPATPIVGIP